MKKTPVIIMVNDVVLKELYEKQDSMAKEASEALEALEDYRKEFFVEVEKRLVELNVLPKDNDKWRLSLYHGVIYTCPKSEQEQEQECEEVKIEVFKKIIGMTSGK